MTPTPRSHTSVLIAALGVMAIGFSVLTLGPRADRADAAVPDVDLTVEVIESGLSIPWGLTFTPDGTMLFTERAGRLKARLANGTVRQLSMDLSDLSVSSEGGLLDVAVDPNFSSNRRIYTCYLSPSDVRVVSWTVDGAYTSATRVSNLVTGIVRTSGRHSGCRVIIGPDGLLYVATGDAASGSAPQSLTSLGGKVLRVSPTTGAGVAGNPFIGSANANTRRIWTAGHRNIQGLAFRPGSNQLWTAEHGPSVNDEINLILGGGNYGWDPVPGYNESVPMTDLNKFPGAVSARWSSGGSTLAISGAAFVNGAEWGGLNGSLAVATLKTSSLRFFRFDPAGNLIDVTIPPELNGTFGRLRTPVMGPDGALYVTTANGSNDKILRVTSNGATPVGVLDGARATTTGISVSGWTFDPDTIRPISVHAYVDGRFAQAFVAAKPRPDLTAVLGIEPNHGYAKNVPAGPGIHTICLYAINNTQPGSNPLLGCRKVTVGNGAPPVGVVDVARARGSGIQVVGWAHDPDTAASISIHAYVDGQFAEAFVASSRRSDVATALGIGPNHGYVRTIPTTAGTHTVCLFAINNAQPGVNPFLGCRTVAVNAASPVGVIDSARAASGGIRVSGWAFDRDTSAPIGIHAYVDGRFVQAFSASAPRPDLATVLGIEPNHGFLQTVPTAPGPHTVCLFGINNIQPGINPLLGCRTVNV